MKSSPQDHAGQFDARTVGTWNPTLPAAVAFDVRLTAGAVRVALALEQHARGKAVCWPCNATLARLTGYGSGHIRKKLLPELERFGWLRRGYDPGTRGRGGEVFIVMWAAGAREALAHYRLDLAVLEPDPVGTNAPGGTYRPRGEGPTGPGGEDLQAPRILLTEETERRTPGININANGKTTLSLPGEEEQTAQEAAQEPAGATPDAGADAQAGDAQEPAVGATGPLGVVRADEPTAERLEAERRAREAANIRDERRERQAEENAGIIRGMVQRATGGELVPQTLEEAVAALGEDPAAVGTVARWMAVDLDNVQYDGFHAKLARKVAQGEEPRERLLDAYAAGMRAKASGTTKPSIVFQRAWKQWRPRAAGATAAAPEPKRAAWLAFLETFGIDGEAEESMIREARGGEHPVLRAIRQRYDHPERFAGEELPGEPAARLEAIKQPIIEDQEQQQAVRERREADEREATKRFHERLRREQGLPTDAGQLSWATTWKLMVASAKQIPAVAAPATPETAAAATRPAKPAGPPAIDPAHRRKLDECRANLASGDPTLTREARKALEGIVRYVRDERVTREAAELLEGRAPAEPADAQGNAQEPPAIPE